MAGEFSGESAIIEEYQKSDQRHWTLKCPACGEWTALDKEFPKTLGQEVKIIRERDDDEYYRACPNCGNELDVDRGEWIADFPDTVGMSPCSHLAQRKPPRLRPKG